jgi:L-threonylcarbamoyladenylate synthase
MPRRPGPSQAQTAVADAERAEGLRSGSAVSQHWLRRARRCLDAGGVLAYPTEAVYGFGCDPRNASAVGRVLAIKGRSQAKGLILIAADFEQLAPLVGRLGPARMEEVLASWPGPVTWLMPARPDTPPWLTGANATLAVRVTAHPLAAALCRVWGAPLVSTSANRSGRPPARIALDVRLRLGAAVDLVLTGPCSGRSRPSTIRDAVSGRVVRA